MKLKTQEDLTRAWPKTWTVPMVVVRCIVFNHGKFIERCLQGFLIQETTFPFEVFVHDDASTDESAAVIRRYAERYPLILNPVYESENQYSKQDGSFFRTAWQPVIQGDHKYIALCEGDDYWTDPKKLQKQVEYMEAHPGCAGCFHERVKCDEDGRIMEGTGLPDAMKRPLTGEDIVAWSFPCPPTCTVLYRREVVMDRPAWMNELFFGDRATAIWAGHAHGTVDWVDGVEPSVYRLHGGGVFRGKSDIQRIESQQCFTRRILEHFPVSRKTRRTIQGAWAREIFWLRRRYNGTMKNGEDRRRVEELHRKACRGAPFYRWAIVRLSFAQRRKCFAETVQCRIWNVRHRIKAVFRKTLKS